MSSFKKLLSNGKLIGIDLKPVMIIVSVFSVVLTVYQVHRAHEGGYQLFSVSILALFAGILFESLRVTDNRMSVIYQFIGAYFISFLYSLPSQTLYNSGHYESTWPYTFLFIFALTAVILNRDKVTAKLTEGITLLLSLSIIYWIIDYGFTANMFEKTLLIVALLFSAFSILNAFTYIRLTPIIRLILSIGSTVIMLAFAADNIYRVFSSEEIENTKYLAQGLNIGIQYFLLGVSAIYIVQNYLLLASFFPGKNEQSESVINDNKKHHIERYSEGQVFIGHALICIFYALTIYGLNFKYHILPRHTMIWLVFLTFPFLIKIITFEQKIRL